MRTRPLRRAATIGVVAILGVTASLLLAHHTERPAPAAETIGGPYAAMLAESTDLGPARSERVRVTVALRGDERPGSLIDWAQRTGLTVRWRPGDSWALLEGRPSDIGAALAVPVHDYRRPEGEVFYASTRQPAVPQPVVHEVSALGRILSYTPHRESRPPAPREVPGQGLTPTALVRTYNAAPLRDAGFTGRDVTVVVFAFDGFDQADLDTFASTFDLPTFTPEVVGGQPPQRRGEATMDLEAVHAVAPDAKKVLVNARPTVEGDAPYARIAAMMEDTATRYPGAVWSFSIGWGCDKLVTAADLEPVRAALRAAQRTGTTAFNASGDLAGLECKGGQAWSAAPAADDVGLDAVASLPEMTSVGGTTLSTDADGGWLAEQAWFDAPLSQGTAGGVSSLFDRPDWQSRVTVEGGAGQRLAPDISAVADPFTGMKIVFEQQVIVGGGTSLAAPIWAGFAAVMNQYLAENGGRLLGNINPLLYGVAQGARLPAFRDIVLGGNAVAIAGPGYDLATGLGTPNLDNLVRNILVLQKLLP